MTMEDSNINKALSYLGASINSLVDASKGPVDLKNIHTHIAKRSLSGDHIIGGKIMNFSSQGITDKSTEEQLIVENEKVSIKSLSIGLIKGDLTVENSISSKKIIVDELEVKNLKTEIKLEKNVPIEFVADSQNSLFGKGLMFKGQGPVKQFIFSKPDKFLSTEDIDLLKEKSYMIAGVPILSENQLGASVTKSNLRELGRLKSLIVDGAVNLGNHIFFDPSTKNTGFGTDEPKGKLSVSENNIEVMIGSFNQNRGMIGTFSNIGFDVITDNTSRISIAGTGEIVLGNSKEIPTQVTVYGKMSIKVAVPDPDVDLHVNGSIRFDNRLHKYSDSMPDAGSYRQGDIFWNSQPAPGGSVGWVCVRAGSPGLWKPFGLINS